VQAVAAESSCGIGVDDLHSLEWAVPPRVFLPVEVSCCAIHFQMRSPKSFDI
jgi:hypothetical protein